ncbi:MAG: hypothetical protein CMJ83_04595 [Planctomycetes bacterium]|jgi:hypothetical protein|nr:hypothetical protein [Planctomycetota bacterium]
MGSKSGKRRRRREREIKKARDGAAASTAAPKTPAPETPAPENPVAPSPSESTKVEPEPVVAAADAVPDPAVAPPEASPVRDVADPEPGPAWSPPPGWSDREQVEEAQLPLTAGPEPLSDPEVSTARLRAPGDLVERTVSISGGRETVQALHRVEERLDRLTDWLASWFQWYEQNRPASSGGGLADRRSLLVLLMAVVFAPVLVVFLVAARGGWLS